MGVILLLGEHLTVSGDIFVCHSNVKVVGVMLRVPSEQKLEGYKSYNTLDCFP